MTPIRGFIAALALVVGVLGLPAVSVAASSHAPDAPRGLIVDEGSQLGITDTPRFSWLVSDRDANEVQTAYQLLVARTPTHDPSDASVIWDSGKVASDQQTYIAYGGPPLASDRTWYWSVRTWDRADNGGPFAKPQRFDTGHLSEAGRARI